MTWFATNLISAFLLPPLNLLLLGATGLLLWYKRPPLARALVAASLALLWLCSTPYFAEGTLHLLEGKPHAVNPKTQPADAIVVLGAGTYFHAPEYDGDTLDEAALMRLRYAAKLQRETGKPILVTGGTPLGNTLPEAEQMKSVLQDEFKVPVRWTEDRSNNTLENALYSYALLQKAGIKRIYLVTHAWHMRRATMVFRQVGFEVVPAPTAWTTRYKLDLLAFIPRAEALRDSAIFSHEIIGLIWYRIKSWL